jgi:hypothetical protein
MIVFLEKGRNLMKHGDKEMKRMKKMGGGMKSNMMMRKDKKHGGTHRSLYAGGGQPSYGNTIDTAMPTTGPN